MNPADVDLITTRIGRFLVFGKDVDIVAQLRSQGVHDPALIKWAADHLGQRAGTADARCIVDVGAHLGTFSIPLARITGLCVEAFEAQRPMAQLLGANYLLNGIETARVHNLALGGPTSPGEIEAPTVDVSQPGNYGAFAVDPTVRAERSASRMRFADRTETIAVRTLDSFNLKDVALIKIDVEGWELPVLEGAVETIRANDRPAILFECWRDPAYAERRAQTIAFVEDLGYRCESEGENIFALAK